LFGSLIPTDTLTITGANVTARGCSFAGIPAAVTVSTGSLAAVQCRFDGDPAADPFEPCGDGLNIGNCSAQLSHCDMFGSNAPVLVHGFQPVRAGHGLVITVSSDVALADCVARGGSSTLTFSAPAGDGMHNMSTVPVRHARCVFVGGSANTPLPPGLPVFGPAVSAALSGIATEPPRYGLGDSYLLRVTADPGTPVLAFGSGDLVTPFRIPQVNDVVWVSPSAVVVIGFQLAPAGGAVFPQTTPNIPSLLDLGFWFGAVSGLTLPLDITAPVGGVVRD